MERVQRMLDRDYKTPSKILELNRSHVLIADLARMVDERPAERLIAPLIEQLFDSALLIEGLHPNPAEMIDRIQTLMEAAARSNPPTPTKTTKAAKATKSKKGGDETVD